MHAVLICEVSVVLWILPRLSWRSGQPCTPSETFGHAPHKLLFYEYHVFWPRFEEQKARDHPLAECIAFENNVLLKLGEMFGQLSGKTRSCIQYFREKTCIGGVRNTQFCQNTQAFGLFICLWFILKTKSFTIKWDFRSFSKWEISIERCSYSHLYCLRFCKLGILHFLSSAFLPHHS